MENLMSIYGTQIITGFIAICSVLLGLFWNQFFSWRKYKRDQKVKLNHLLFNLLELHHFVLRHDFSEFIKLYLQMIEDRLGKLSQEEKTQVLQIVLPIIKEKLNDLKSDEEIKRLSEHYELSVKEIASINPFLAHRLAGQSEQLRSFDVMTGYFDSVRHLVPTTEGQTLFENITQNYSIEKIIKEMIDDVKDSIINVSKEIGIYKKVQSIRYLSRKEKSIQILIKAEIKKIIDQIEAQINQQKSLTPNELEKK
jgi:hypothetical protein